MQMNFRRLSDRTGPQVSRLCRRRLERVCRGSTGVWVGGTGRLSEAGSRWVDSLSEDFLILVNILCILVKIEVILVKIFSAWASAHVIKNVN